MSTRLLGDNIDFLVPDISRENFFLSVTIVFRILQRADTAVRLKARNCLWAIEERSVILFKFRLSPFQGRGHCKKHHYATITRGKKRRLEWLN